MKHFVSIEVAINLRSRNYQNANKFCLAQEITIFNSNTSLIRKEFKLLEMKKCNILLKGSNFFFL